MIKRISIAVGDEVRVRSAGFGVGRVVRLFWEGSALYADVTFGGDASVSFNVYSLDKLSGRACMEIEDLTEALAGIDRAVLGG